MVLVDIDIQTLADDGHVQHSGGTIYNLSTGDSVLSFKLHSTLTDQEVRAYLRFDGVTIPQGSTIDDATLNVSLAKTGQAVLRQLTVSALNSNDPALPNTVTGGQVIFTGAKISNTVTTSIPANQNAFTQTPLDVTSMVQELVNAFDYSNEAILLTLKTSSALPFATDRQSAYARDSGVGVDLANLTINYTGPVGVCIPQDVELIGSLLDIDTQEITTSSKKVGQRRTFTQQEVDTIGAGFSKIQYWIKGKKDATAQASIWSDATVGTATETVVANTDIITADSNINQFVLVTQTFLDSTGTFAKPFKPTVGVEYVIGIEMTALTNRTETGTVSSDVITGNLTEREGGNWTDIVGEDWSLGGIYTIPCTGLDEFGVGALLLADPTAFFNVDAILDDLANPHINALDIDAILDDVTGPELTHTFLISAFLKALGVNGTCEQDELDVIYDNLTPIFNTFDRIGGPFGASNSGAPNPVTRIGWRIDGPTLVGKDIKLIRVSRMRVIDGSPSGNLFMTVRDSKDKIRAISNIINANTIPTSPTISINFTLEKTIKLQQDDKILMEMDNCTNCAPAGGNDPSVLWGASTSLTIPTGMVGVLYRQGFWKLVDGTSGTVGYTERTTPTNYAKFDFTSDTSFIEGAQRGCFDLDAVLKKTNNKGFAEHIDDMSDAGNWGTSDATNISVSGGVINWTALRDGTNDTIAQFFADTTIPRLATPVDVKGWKARAKVTFNTVGLGSNDNAFFISLSNRGEIVNASDITPPTPNGFEDAVGWKFSVGSGGPKIIGFTKIQLKVGIGFGFPPEDIVTMDTALTTGTFFLEIERLSRTKMAWRIFTDSTYQTILEERTGPIDSRIIGIRVGAGGDTGLRFFKAGNDGNFAASAETLSGTIDDFVIRQNRTDGMASHTTVTGADGTFAHRLDVKLFQVFGTGGAGFNVDAVLLKTQDKNFTVDADILFARAAAIDAKLAVPIDVTQLLFTTPEAIIPQDTFNIDAILVGTKELFTVDALLIIVPSRLTLVDAFIQKDLTKPFTVDAVLKALGDNASCLNPQTTFSEDFTSYANQVAADAAWIPNNLIGFIRADADANEIQWQNRNVGTNNSIAYDLFTNNGITVSDTAWILRFKHRVNPLDLGSSVGKYLWIGLFDSDQSVDSETTQDAIAFYINIASGGNGINLAQRDGVILSNAGTNSTLTKINTANDTFWVDLRRTSATNATLSIYSDHLFTQLIESTSLTIPASLTGLRYIAVKNRNLATTTGLMGGTTDDIDFWNGVTTIPAVIETGITVECPTVDAVLKCLGVTGSCTATYLNSMDLASEWQFGPIGTGFFRLLGAGPIDFNLERDSGNDFCSIDFLPNPFNPSRLGQALDDESFTARWTLRWTTLTSGNGNQLYMGLSDSGTLNFNDNQTFTDQNGILIQIVGSTPGTPSDPRWIPMYKDGTALPVSLGVSVPNLFTTGVTYGIEIRRNTATSVTYTLFSDSSFTTILQTDTLTIPSTVTGLQFFKATNHDTANTGEFVMQGELDDLSVSTPRAAGTVGTNCVTCSLVDACISLSTVVETFTVDSILIVSPSELSLVDALLTTMPSRLYCVDAILQASGANGACPAGGETISTVLDNIDIFDTQVNTTQSNFKVGQRWTPTVGEVSLLQKGITKVNLWHGHVGGSGNFDTFVWQNATAGTSSETIVRDGGNFNFIGNSSGISKRLRILFDAGGVNPQIWLPTAGVEYVIGITENFPGTAQTRKTSVDSINGVFTTRASAGVWVNTAGQDWALQFTIEQSGLGQGGQNFCLGVDGRLQLVPFHNFTVDAILVEAVAVNTQNFLIDGLLAIMPSELYCVDSILQAFGLTEIFEVDALLDIVAIETKDFIVDALILRTGDLLCSGISGVFFQEDFTTNIGWSNSGGSLIRIDDVTFPNVMRLVNLTSTTQGIKRAIKALTTPFTPSGNFIWEFKHIHDTSGGGGFASEFTIELKETVNNAGQGASATETTIRYRTDVVPSVGPERLRLEVHDNNGTNSILSLPESSIILQSNFTYYPRITKTGNIVKLELFTDAGRTIQETGSPVQVDVTGFDMSQTLAQIYVGNYDTGGPARVANEEIDDIFISNSFGCPILGVDSLIQVLGDNASCSELQTIVSARGEQDDTFGPGISGTTQNGEGMAVRFTPKVNFRLKNIEWNSTKGTGFQSGAVRGRLYLGSTVPTSGVFNPFFSTRIANADGYGGSTPNAEAQFITFWNTGSQLRRTTFDNRGLNDGRLLEAGVQYLIVLQENDVGTGWTLSTTTVPPGNSSTDGSNPLTEKFLTVDGTEHWNATGSGSNPLQVIQLTGEEFAFNMNVNAPTNAGCAEVDAKLLIIGMEGFTVDAILTPLFVVKEFDVDAKLNKQTQFSVDTFLNRQVQFIVDVSITPDTGLFRDVADLITRVLFEDEDLGGSGLTGRQIVENFVAITTVELQWGFTGKNSRIRSYLNTMKFFGIVQEDGSDPDWYETIWTLVNFPP